MVAIILMVVGKESQGLDTPWPWKSVATISKMVVPFGSWETFYFFLKIGGS